MNRAAPVIVGVIFFIGAAVAMAEEPGALFDRALQRFTAAEPDR